MSDPSKGPHLPPLERTTTCLNARTRVLALVVATPDPPVCGESTHGDMCPRCEAAVLTGRFNKNGEQVLECERCLYRP